MNATMRWLIASLSLIVAVPSFSTEATQLWHCEMYDDTTEEDVEQHTGEWLKAARTMKGGANLKVTLHFPVAVTNMGETDFLMTIESPSLKEWGEFWDGYSDSAAADKESASDDKFICPDSSMWESYKIGLE